MIQENLECTIIEMNPGPENKITFWPVQYAMNRLITSNFFLKIFEIKCHLVWIRRDRVIPKFQVFLTICILLICQKYLLRNVISLKMYSAWFHVQVDWRAGSHKLNLIKVYGSRKRKTRKCVSSPPTLKLNMVTPLYSSAIQQEQSLGWAPGQILECAQRKFL